MVRTPASAPVPGLKLASNVPFALNRAIRARFVLFTVVNSPPINTLPSGWTATAKTGASTPAPTLKAASTAPLVFSSTKLARPTPLNELNEPPTASLPSGRTATANTGLSGPEPMVKDESSEPSAWRRAR